MNLEIPITIELGALNSRDSDIYVDEFWTALPEVNEARRSTFICYVESIYQNIKVSKSPWECKNTPNEIYSSELKDMELSVNYLKGIEI